MPASPVIMDTLISEISLSSRKSVLTARYMAVTLGGTWFGASNPVILLIFRIPRFSRSLRFC